MADVAINDSTVSIKLGKYAAILSFFFNLIDKKKFIILHTFVFNSLQDLTFLKPFSLTNVIAFELSFFINKFSAKFNFEFLRNLFLKNTFDFSNLSFLMPMTLVKSQIELQNFLGFFMLHLINFLYF